MESSRVVSNQIYYKQSEEFAPRYKYVKINMSNIMSNVVPVTADGTTQVQFKLPYNTVYNLSKSKIATLIPVPAQGGTVVSNTVADAWPFGNQTVSFETGNGLQLLNLPESSKYTKILTKINTPFNQYMTSDLTDIPHVVPSSLTDAQNPTGLGTAGSSFFESQYYRQSAAGVANAIPVFYELSNFVHTILSLDKDLYFSQNDMYLKYTIGGTKAYSFQSATGTITNTPATLSSPIVELQNVYLYLAVEQQPQIIESIVQAYQTSGLRILFDYPIVTKYQSAASSNQAVVIPFVPAQGKYLKRIYHTLWNTGEYTNTALDCENNVANPKVLSYNTYLDSMKLQDDQITAAKAPDTTLKLMYADDWRLNQPFCSDSVLSNYAIYQKNWFHCDDFTCPKNNTVGDVSSDNIKNGLAMERGLQYQFIATTTNSAYIHDNFAIFSREVLINKDGVQFV